MDIKSKTNWQFLIHMQNDIDIDSMKINDLIKFIQENPSVLKRPIMIDERRFLVGYNSEEIRVFIPKELR